MRHNGLAQKLFVVAIVTLAYWVGVKMGSDRKRAFEDMPELSEADKKKFAQEAEMYKLHPGDGSFDIPITREEENESLPLRYDPLDGGVNDKTVRGWPSVGGIIIAERVHPLELKYLGLDRFNKTSRSLNAAEEDEFCMRLCSIGGKWWLHFSDFLLATGYKLRRVYPLEKEVLYLAWPEVGGVCVLRYRSWQQVGRDINDNIVPFGIVCNALTMEERCEAIRRCGGRYFKDPNTSEHVRPLLEGFGEHERWDTRKHGHGELLKDDGPLE
jgi:hypothetical protein